MLTDNEKTVVTARHAGIPEFHPTMEKFCVYYGTSIQVCQPADPATKGGVEASVKLAKDDIVPKETNLRGEYGTFAQVEKACQEFMAKVNRRPHRITGVEPEELLEHVESATLGALPVDAPYTLFGEIRKVPTNIAMVSVDNVQYSVPEELAGKDVYVTFQTHAASGDEQVVIYYHDLDGVEEVARHFIGTRGTPQIDPEHFTWSSPQVPGYYPIKPQSRQEKEFLSIGPNAENWLRMAVAHHAPRIKTTMDVTLSLAAQFGNYFADCVLEEAHNQGLLTDWDIQTQADHIQQLGLATGIGPDEKLEPESLSHQTSGWEGYYTTSYQSERDPEGEAF